MIKLPNIIPVFPLSNFILFPKTSVPLNIFEPRYIAMIDDSMKTNKMIGLIQPKKNNTNAIHDLYNVGCLGKITSFKDTSDGRYLIDLTSQIDNDSIVINLKDPSSPVLIRDFSDKNSFHVVIPMKI